MKTLLLFVSLVLLFTSSVSGGRIFGTIKEGGRHIGPNKQVEICDSNGQIAVDTTDAYGSYSIYVPLKGKFALTLQYSNSITTDPVEIYSYNNSAARYDFILYQVDSNHYRLKRK